MIAGLTALLACQLLGEIVVRALGLPVPGPVLGMVLLVGLFALRLRVFGRDDLAGHAEPVGVAADGLLRHFGILFVPAGVGIVQYLGLIGANGLAISAALIGSTLLALVATVGTFVLVRRLIGTTEDEP